MLVFDDSYKFVVGISASRIPVFCLSYAEGCTSNLYSPK